MRIGAAYLCRVARQKRREEKDITLAASRLCMMNDSIIISLLKIEQKAQMILQILMRCRRVLHCVDAFDKELTVFRHYTKDVHFSDY